MVHLLSFYRLNRCLTKSVYRVISPLSLQFFASPLKSNTPRCLSTIPVQKTVTQNKVQDSKNITWNLIYHLPLIQFGRLLNRLKLYQSAFTVSAVPISIGFYYYDMTSLKSMAIITGAATFTCVTLYVVTYFFQRLIGAVFVDENLKNVKIAHLTFWGNRKDIILPINEIIPLTDSTCNVHDAFFKLQRYNSEEFLYMSLRFGKIRDKAVFQKIFGDFDILGIKK